MDLALSSDQVAILDALDTLTRPYASTMLHSPAFALTDPRLDAELEAAGFLDVALMPELGFGTAALVVERLARLPQATPSALRALVQPLLDEPDDTPLCMADAAQPGRPLRFLQPGARVLLLGDDVRIARVTEPELRPHPAALYGYPVASLRAWPANARPVAADPERIRLHGRLALAAESAGLLAAALSSVCAHVTDRQQFGRPLAAFQAIRHRLAEAQVRTNGVYWLAMRAACTLNPGDAALAALHAQESARGIVYDLHQFMGAMGMTLEHPLHLWTYRLKYLASETGGRGGQALAAAAALWG